MKEKVGIVKNRTRNSNFLELWKSFWNPAIGEVTEEEAILNDVNLSNEDKKELLNSLKDNEKLANRLFKDSYKTLKLEVDAKVESKVKLKDKKVEKKDISKDESHEIGD